MAHFGTCKRFRAVFALAVAGADLIVSRAMAFIGGPNARYLPDNWLHIAAVPRAAIAS